MKKRKEKVKIIDEKEKCSSNLDEIFVFEDLVSATVGPLFLNEARARFDLFSPDERLAALQFVDVIEENLRQWKSFECGLPPSAFEQFVVPRFPDVRQEHNLVDEEMQAAARDPASGLQRKLNKDQLTELRKTGIFSVAAARSSQRQQHRWKVSELAILGTTNIADAWKQAAAFAIEQCFVSIPNRLWGRASDRDFLSVPSAVKAIGNSFVYLVDLLFGLHRRDYTLTEESAALFTRLAGLLSLLTVSETQSVPYTVRYKTKSTYQSSTPTVFDVATEIALKGTSHSLSVRRLFASRSLHEQGKAAIEHASVEWNRVKLTVEQESRQKWLSEHRIQKNDDLTKEQRFQLQKYIWDQNELKRNEITFKHLTAVNNESLLIRARAGFILMKAAAAAENRRKQAVAEHRDYLQSRYSIRAKSETWLELAMESFKEQYDKKNRYQQWQDVEMLMKNDDLLAGTMYPELVSADQKICQFEIPKLLNQLKERNSLKSARADMNTRRRIWNPRNWPITGQPGNLSAVKHVTYSVSTFYFGWRWPLMFQRMFVWFMNIEFFWLAVVLLNGPLSVKALVLPQAFKPSKRVHPRLGLVTDDSVVVPTFLSRLRDLWAHVRQSRAKFEAEPDTGLLGKSVTRVFNVVWNYCVKGVFGTLLIVVLFPPFVVLSVALSLCMIVLAPVYVPVLCLLDRLVVQLLLIDRDHVHGSGTPVYFPLIQLVLRQFVLRGLCKLVFSLLSAFVFHPLLSILVLALASLRFVLRSVYDAVIFYCIVKPRGRVPVTDSFIARRIAGPTFSRTVHTQISSEEVLVALRGLMERKLLLLLAQFERNLLQYPTNRSKRIVNRLLSPLVHGGTPVMHESEYTLKKYTGDDDDTADSSRSLKDQDQKTTNKKKQQQQQQNKGNGHFSTLLKGRMRKLPKVPLYDGQRRQRKAALEETIRLAVQIVQRFCENCILPSVRLYGPSMQNVDQCLNKFGMAEPEQQQNPGDTEPAVAVAGYVDQWWSQHGLLPNDWRGLTELWLNEAVGPRFTVPLEDQDESFALDYDRVTFIRFLKGIESGIPQDHLETFQKTYSDDNFVDSTERPFYHCLSVEDCFAPPTGSLASQCDVPSLQAIHSQITAARSPSFDVRWQLDRLAPVLLPPPGFWSLKGIQAVNLIHQCLVQQPKLHPKDCDQVRDLVSLPGSSDGQQQLLFCLPDTDGLFDKKGNRLSVNTSAATENELIDLVAENADIVAAVVVPETRQATTTPSPKPKKKKKSSLKSSKVLIDVDEKNGK